MSKKHFTGNAVPMPRKQSGKLGPRYINPRRPIQRPETRFYENIECPKCRSVKVIKDEHRECGRVFPCGLDSCEGCGENFISNKQVSQSFRCLDCNNIWSEISSL